MQRILQTALIGCLAFTGLVAMTSCSKAADCSSKWLPESGQRGEQFSSAPKTIITTSCSYTAQLNTSKGVIDVKLNPKPAPVAVNNFVFLATHKFYTHILFHRVMVGFMIQSGDPTGTGSGGPGYSFKVENSGSNYTAGTMAMANTGQPDSNGSQFFICDTGSGCSGLDSAWSTNGIGYTILGQVTKGMSVVHALATVPVKANSQGEASQPITPIYLQSVRIHRS
jgi:cyclophilin family peptidyl-prolyl cis-trans isomerase